MNQKISYRFEIKETLKLSFPIVIAQLGVILMTVTDNLLVGRFLGSTALGAAGIANSVSFLITSIGFGGLPAIGALISQAKGRGDENDINRLFHAGLRVAVILSIATGIIVVTLAYNFELFGQTEQIGILAKPFLLIMCWSSFPMFLFIAARQLCDGLSYPRVAMVITVTALILNATLNYFLINGIWIFPKLGLNGSATATLIARIYMAVTMLTYLYFSKRFNTYTRLKTSEPLWPLILKIIKLAIPTGFQFFFEIAAFSLAIIMVGWLGENQLAAHQIAINVASATYMMATGIAAAGAIRVGRAFGKQSPEGVLKAGTSAFICVTGFMGICCLLFLTSNDFLVRLYLTDNPPVMRIAADLLLIAALFQLSDGIQAVFLGALRGISDVNIPTGITFFAYWGVSLPLCYLLGFTFNMDVTGIWIALSVGLTVSAILLSWRFYRLAKKLKF